MILSPLPKAYKRETRKESDLHFGNRTRSKMTRIFLRIKQVLTFFSRGGHKVKPSDPFSVIQLNIHTHQKNTRVVKVPSADRGRKWHVCRVRLEWRPFLNCCSMLYCKVPRKFESLCNGFDGQSASKTLLSLSYTLYGNGPIIDHSSAANISFLLDSV